MYFTNFLECRRLDTVTTSSKPISTGYNVSYSINPSKNGTFLSISSCARSTITSNFRPHIICPRLNILPVPFVAPLRLFFWYAARENHTQKPPQILLIEPAVEQLVATQAWHHLSDLPVHHELLVSA